MEVSLGKMGRDLGMRQEMEGMRDTGRTDRRLGERRGLRPVRQKRRLDKVEEHWGQLVRGNPGERQAAVDGRTCEGSGCHSGSI